MKKLVQKAVVASLAIAAVGAVLIWGGQSLPTSHASSGIQPAATAVALPIAPAANGFTEVAKAVTPAVVNITTVTGEKVADGRKIPDELRDRMEEFLAGLAALVDSAGHKVPVSLVVIVAVARDPG